MPRVRAGEREVATAPIPGVRKQTGGSAIAEGAGVEAAKVGTGEAIARLGGAVAALGVRTYADLAEDARRRADSVAILEAERKIGEWENKRLYDPQSGALNVRGKDAMGLPETLAAEYATLTGEIEKGLGTDRQREAFARVKTSRGLGLDLTIQRHVAGEINRYEGEELQATVENAQQSAVANALDPDRVAQELDRAVGAIKTHAPRLGLGPQAIEKQVARVTSQTHKGVIDRLLANDLDQKAKAYFDEVKGQISGEMLGQVEKALDEGTLRGQSQRKADEIVTAGGTLTDQREKAKAITDPKLRDAVEARIEHNAAIAEREDREIEEKRLNAAYDTIDRTGDWTKIPASVWTDLPGSARLSLKNYAEDKARGIPTKTDLGSYYTLTNLVTGDRDKFLTTNLIEYRGKLSEGDFKQMADLQMRLRAGDDKAADKVVNGFRTNAEIWNGVLVTTKLDKDSTEANELHKELDRRIDRFQQDIGKEATNEQKQLIADNLVGKVVLEPGGWANILPGGKPFYDVTKKSYEITIADIPAAQKSAVEAGLKARGIATVTNDMIVDAWLSVKRRLGEIK